MRRVPDQSVLDWLDQQPRTSVWTTSVTILEVRLGLQILAAGRRRTALTEAFDELLQKWVTELRFLALRLPSKRAI